MDKRYDPRVAKIGPESVNPLEFVPGAMMSESTPDSKEVLSSFV